MGYKLIATDIDGTLLNSNLEISSDTVKAIKEVQEKGILFTLATGRPIVGVKNIIDKLDIKCPVITYNGAKIVDSLTNQVLYKKELDISDAKKILELGNLYNVIICAWSNDKVYVNRIEPRLERYKKISGVEPILINDYDEFSKNGITKIIWYEDAKKIEKLKQLLDPNIFSNVAFATSQPYFLEFFNNEVNKGIALERICEILNIDVKETIAFGDGLNDFPMVKAAGLGIAMENGNIETKKAAKFVTLSNDNDGIAYAINKFILK